MPGLGKIGKIGKITDTERKRRRPPPEMTAGEIVATSDLLSDELKKVARLIGEGKAMKIHRMRERGEEGSVPELLVQDWLDGHNVEYEKQLWLPEANTRLDFHIRWGDIALRVQGEYWHPKAMPNDDEIRYALTLMGFQVVDVWEGHVYRQLNTVMSKAIAGIETPR